MACATFTGAAAETGTPRLRDMAAAGWATSVVAAVSTAVAVAAAAALLLPVAAAGMARMALTLRLAAATRSVRKQLGSWHTSASRSDVASAVCSDAPKDATSEAIVRPTSTTVAAALTICCPLARGAKGG